ncbi:hypothetical protein ACFWNN_23375 [Lentzea sp. NPDC058450]|uniref:hypothetical protein n=1 Tax=Lentzea sp. NPDC058450 TaxID=3346505 RepID=UPI00365B80DD
MARKNRRKRATSYLVFIGVFAVFCVVALNRENYWRAAVFGVAALCWIVAARFPVKCAVTTRQGLSCRNGANGVLFGCSQAGHTWIKFRAHFGRHERVRAAAAPARTAAVSIAEPGRATVLFWLTVVATSAGFISMTTDVIGLFE